MIINGQRYEAEPAVEAYVKELETEKNSLSEQVKRLETEIAKLDISYYNAALAITRLRAENARLEKGYQKATGVIATDSLPTAVDCYKLKKMCIENQGCRECAFRRENFEGFDRCAFEGLPMDWNFGGAE